MKKIFALLLSFYLFSDSAIAGCQLTDDQGNKINLSQPAQRIISLAPDLTETLFAVGAGNKIVGVVQGSDYPIAAKKIPMVASYNSIDIERIITLHPDLIVVWLETSYLPQLKKLGIPVYFSHQQRLTDVAATMKKLGCLAGTGDIANHKAEEYLQHYQKIKTKYAKKNSVQVFYQIWPQPLITITKNSWINEAIVLCGGNNIFAALPGAAPEVSIEAVVVANPDIIIGTKSEGLQQWRRWKQLNAVKNHKLSFIHADLLERAGPRLLDGVEEVCGALSYSV